MLTLVHSLLFSPKSLFQTAIRWARPLSSGSAYPELERVQLSLPPSWRLFLCLLPVCCHSIRTCLHLKAKLHHSTVDPPACPSSSLTGGREFAAFCTPSHALSLSVQWEEYVTHSVDALLNGPYVIAQDCFQLLSLRHQTRSIKWYLSF